MTKALFVTGTDTGVGKTIVVSLLARYLREQGHQTITQKWVQTGIREEPSDVATHLQLMGVDPASVAAYAQAMNPYIFELPASPHLAAAQENVQVDTQTITTAFRELTEAFETVIVEGVGGLMVPLNETTLIVDLVETLELPTVIVATNKLGTVNHTLLTVDALKKRNIPILGIVFNMLKTDQEELVVQDNPKIIETFTNVPILGQLPRTSDLASLYQHFVPIGQRLFGDTKRTEA